MGTKGNSLRIVPNTAGIMSICDVKVLAKKPDNEPTEQAQNYCKDWRAQCNTLLNEDKDNCLERFGE
jgi:hypothetical protein